MDHAGSKLKTLGTPGDIIVSRDGKQYQVQKDGSWRRVQDAEPGEFERVQAEQAAAALGLPKPLRDPRDSGDPA